MKLIKRNIAVVAAVALSVIGVSCGGKQTSQAEEPQEDRNAKQQLQGIWVNDEDEDIAFKAKGDTIFYPDSTSQPVYFQVFGDTLVLHGANDVKYPIVKLTHHLFIFRNQNGDEVKLKLSENPDDASLFMVERPEALNQNQLIKRDTIVTQGSEKYHCYVQINPTTYKVIKASYNDEGVEVDNVYYDNIINLHIYHGAQKLFSRDFRKQAFEGKVPKEFLRQSILSDLKLSGVDATGIHYVASLVIPDSMSSFEVEVAISYDGRMMMRVK